MENIKAASMVMFIVIMLCFSSNRPGVEGVRGEENDLIEAICKKTSYPDVCIKTLRSSPGSSGADVKGLAHIIVESASTYSNDTYEQIKKLLKETKDKAMRNCLDVCFQVYDLTIHDIPKAIKYLESGDYDSATEYANDGIIDSDTCESSFKEFPEIPKSPLTDRNNGLTELCVIALDMINLLK
ncbi:Pectinesterase inhibitor 28 [Citrus sinensis]|uniref:Pectinesterase inhibitor 28 n=1 Tax=Citrus sinensis TaxID=2711 RepID=A0ACB8K914_CITSI|nr:Pectinesterase inhibitor 28 [Citrus sinensis]